MYAGYKYYACVLINVQDKCFSWVMVTIKYALVLFRMLSFLLMKTLTLIPGCHVKGCQILGTKTM